MDARERVEVPAVVRQRLALLGEEGERCLAAMADLVAGLERRWSISVGAPLTLERVSSGLFLQQLGAQDLARPFLATAERLAAVDPG